MPATYKERDSNRKLHPAALDLYLPAVLGKTRRPEW